MKTEKRCARHNDGAGAILPASSFYVITNRQGNPALGGYCKECCKQAATDYRQANPEQANRAIRKWRRKNPEAAAFRYPSQVAWTANDKIANPAKWTGRYRKHQLKRYYGLTMEEYAALLALQNGRCGICSKSESKGRSFHIDHDHASGQLRGILCDRCNNCLERIETHVDWHNWAISYLVHHRENPSKRYVSAACYMRSSPQSRKRKTISVLESPSTT